MNGTPRANRIHIAFFGLRNAGKSTLVNAFTGQDLAIVSETPGTTTDPVSKAMEILPLGPCLVTDTAGLDDVGELGARRVRRTLDVLATTDVAVWVTGEATSTSLPERGQRLYLEFLKECRTRRVTAIEFHRGDSVAALREKIASLKPADDTPGLLDGLVQAGDRVICVCPIDAAAPKGRLILPQVQVIRSALDLHATCEVCQPGELGSVLEVPSPSDSREDLVVTDSQAFGAVREMLAASRLMSRVSRPGEGVRHETRDASRRREAGDVRLTSFSILFARQKGDLGEYAAGLAALGRLKDGDTVLIAEGCTHHRQCDDIGTVKIPKALAKLSGRKLNFLFASGGDFPVAGASLVVQCGGCMLTRREVLRRIGLARAAEIPIVNYGMVLAAASGMDVEADACCLASSASRLATRQGRETRDARREPKTGDVRQETRARDARQET